MISDKIQSRKPPVQEFAIPAEATASGHLELEWSSGEGERSCEVAEVWLIHACGLSSERLFLFTTNRRSMAGLIPPVQRTCDARDRADTALG